MLGQCPNRDHYCGIHRQNYELFFDCVGFIKDLTKQYQSSLLRNVKCPREEEPCVKPFVGSPMDTSHII
jgi:hypothetical protein